MAKHEFFLIGYISFIFIFILSFFCMGMDEERKVHIVYMGSLPEGAYSPVFHHLNMLGEVIENGSVADSLVRSYGRSFNGFSAKLTSNEIQKLIKMNGVVSVFPSTILHPQTTRSWDFMGLKETTSHNSTGESDVIVGVIDTGIWPESKSFKDDGFSPAPKKWKGICLGGKNFTCNNKIIGARFYNSSIRKIHSARDDMGHGTHCASIAAGNIVKNVSFYGLAQGNARGAVPSARIATYKVCDPDQGCGAEDIMAAFDDAIADGVDIISVSLANVKPTDFNEDVIAIGAFHGMEKGVLTVHSAGNNGPHRSSSASLAPWLLSVAASSIDRQIIDKVVLGNGKALIGRSVNSFALNGTKFPLIYGKQAAAHSCSEESARSCQEYCIDSKLVKGKILLCDLFGGNMVAFTAGALGSIMNNLQFDDVSLVLPLPASALSKDDYEAVLVYMNSTKQPQGYISKSEATKDVAAPTVASFSSRGPNSIAPDIMKPDISAPGVDILASFSPAISPSDAPEDKRRVEYNILSGTSMSCPHVSGAAAYVKAFHPNWSPSAIKSSLMTTAWSMNSTKYSEGEFAYGSGHIDPIKAVNPGLVYEAFEKDYVEMLCSVGYDEKKLRSISGKNDTCSGKASQRTPVRDLNYPSMTAQVSPLKPFVLDFHRTVSNVALQSSTYKVKFFPNPKIQIQVVPEVLSFKSLGEKLSFVVTVSGRGLFSESVVSSSLIWYDDIHIVRSPVVVHAST